MEKILNQKSILSPFAKRCIYANGRYAMASEKFIPTMIVHGFTIYSQKFHVYNEVRDVTFVTVYMVRPNNSPRWFVFRTLDSVIDFCYMYTNYHSEKFWLSKFSELFLFPAVVRLAVQLLPEVAFTDDDLPF